VSGIGFSLLEVCHGPGSQRVARAQTPFRVTCPHSLTLSHSRTFFSSRRTCVIGLAEVVSDHVGPHVRGAERGRRVHSVVRGHLDPGRTCGHAAAQTLQHVQRRPACDLPRHSQHQHAHRTRARHTSRAGILVPRPRPLPLPLRAPRAGGPRPCRCVQHRRNAARLRPRARQHCAQGGRAHLIIGEAALGGQLVARVHQALRARRVARPLLHALGSTRGHAGRAGQPPRGPAIRAQPRTHRERVPRTVVRSAAAGARRAPRQGAAHRPQSATRARAGRAPANCRPPGAQRSARRPPPVPACSIVVVVYTRV